MSPSPNMSLSVYIGELFTIDNIIIVELGIRE